MIREDGNLSDADIAELAAFADGSLPARRRRKVAAAVRVLRARTRSHRLHDRLRRPAGVAAGWKQTRRDGVELRSTERDGTTTVTWLREGRTCVLSGAAVPREELLALAAWRGEGTVSF
jgi:hypothetical protein